MAWIWYGPPIGSRFCSRTQSASSDAGAPTMLVALELRQHRQRRRRAEELRERDDVVLELLYCCTVVVGLYCVSACTSSTLYLPAMPPLALTALEVDLVASGQRLADDGDRAGQRREDAELDRRAVEARRSSGGVAAAVAAAVALVVVAAAPGDDHRCAATQREPSRDRPCFMVMSSPP